MRLEKASLPFALGALCVGLRSNRVREAHNARIRARKPIARVSRVLAGLLALILVS